jgi:hypothetical protein
MKKYTNKILIAALVLFFAVLTIRFFIIASEVKKEMTQSETNELNINY